MRVVAVVLALLALTGAEWDEDKSHAYKKQVPEYLQLRLDQLMARMRADTVLQHFAKATALGCARDMIKLQNTSSGPWTMGYWVGKLNIPDEYVAGCTMEKMFLEKSSEKMFANLEKEGEKIKYKYGKCVSSKYNALFGGTVHLGKCIIRGECDFMAG